MTNELGRRKINDFDIFSQDWHISDHRPITLEIEIEIGVDIGGMIKRADDLNRSNNQSTVEIQQFKGRYDVAAIENELLGGKEEIERSVNQFIANNDIQAAIDTFDEHIKKVHRHHKKKRIVQDTPETINFAPVNDFSQNF